MMKAFLKLIAGSLLVMAVVLGLSFMSLQAADAQSAQESACLGSGGNWVNNTCVDPDDPRTVPDFLRQVGNILIFLVGGISVLMAIIGGLRYTISQGDQSSTTAAKNTILYAIIGLVLSVAAYGLVNFITVQLG
jgi:hypothetical protein